MEQSLYELYDQMREDSLIFSYKGAIDQTTLVALGTLIKEVFSGADVKKKTIKRVFGILIELAQNILRYSAERTDQNGSDDEGIGIIVVRERGESYIISSGNQVKKDQAATFAERCEFINSRSEDQLKDLYREQMEKPRGENKNAAGLGLIEMARKSRGGLTIKLEELAGGSTFAILSVEVPKNEPSTV